MDWFFFLILLWIMNIIESCGCGGSSHDINRLQFSQQWRNQKIQIISNYQGIIHVLRNHVLGFSDPLPSLFWLSSVLNGFKNCHFLTWNNELRRISHAFSQIYIPIYDEYLWGISANVINHFGLFITHSFTNSSLLLLNCGHTTTLLSCEKKKETCFKPIFHA